MSFDFTNKDELRQALLELHYDLLDEGEAQQLRAAIESDPDVAGEWAATLRLAGKLTDAAKFEAGKLPTIKFVGNDSPAAPAGAEAPTTAETTPPIRIDAPPSSNGRAADDGQPIVAQLIKADADAEKAKVERSPRTPLTAKQWWIRSTSLAAVAASIGMVMIGNLYTQRVPNAPLAVVRLQAEAATGDQPASENEYQVVTTRMDGSPATVGQFPVTPATISFAVMSRNATLFSGTSETSGEGLGRIRLPEDLIIPKDAVLRISAQSPDPALSGTSIEIPLEPTRCLTFLKVDRPVYRPGETVYFRSLTLRRRSLRANSDVPIRYELIDPSGAIVPGAFTEGVTLRGVGNGSFTIPTTAPGGPYTLVAKSLDGFFPDESCEFQVRAYRVPRFKKELDFRKRSYGPGETVEADFSAERAEGGQIEGATIRVTAKVDDEVVYDQTTTGAPSSDLFISFSLPSLIRTGEGQLSVTIDDGGTRETKSKTIPIQLGQIAVDFYPEGGYLVDGLKNRVYFVARNSLGDPVHISGEIQDRAGQNVADVETLRDGMGRFELVPVRGERYTLKIIEPVDITNSPRLPSVVQDLPVIDTGNGVFGSDEPLSMVVRMTSPMKAIVRAVCRGQLVGQSELQLQTGDNTVTIPIRQDVGGVVRVTVLDAESNPARPLVERLVFRRHERQLQVEIVEDESARSRSPGDQMRLTLQVRDEQGQPTAAVLGISVVDDAALSLDDRERPDLRTHFLLTSEVEKPEDLEHANFYLSDDSAAAESLDLLLGTQGWRRFVSGSESQPNVDFREQLIRLLELDGSDLSKPDQSVDNVSQYSPQWTRYRAALDTQWRRLLTESRILLATVLFFWLLSIILHYWRRVRMRAAIWLLIASTSAFIYGCGSAPTSVVQLSESAPTEDAAVGSAPEMEMMMADEESPAPASSVAPAANLPVPTAPPADESFGAIAPPLQPIVDGEWDSDSARLANLTGKDVSPPRTISAENLKQLMRVRGLDAEALADQLLDELRFPVRQYAHQHKSSTGEVRDDFTETLYWQPMLITDSSGKAEIRFDLSDSVTTFRVSVDGHSADGRIGSGGGAVTSRMPFQIEPKLPLEVTTGDRIDLPVAVINATDAAAAVKLSLSADSSLQPAGDTTRAISLQANERRREHVSFDVVAGSAEHDAAIEIRGVASAGLADSVRRSIHISPAGYPLRESIAGRLNERSVIRLPIRDDMVPGSLAVTVRAYPSPVADVMSGIESILREPHGCFEQTSATNYPNTMALLYLKKTETANPNVSRRALGMLDRGYQKLISFECERLGYEWFGDDPGHEALSAFGLMQFADMSRVMAVSQEMIARTRQWLMARRDGQGGFHRNPRHLHVWSVQQPVVNAYVLWAISEADVASGNSHRTASELAIELDELNRVASGSSDAYLVALSAAALMNVQRTADGERLLQKLADLQQQDGSLVGETTVTSSGGLSLKMESSAIGVLAWLKSPKFLPNARLAAKWISDHRQGNAGFGSTQATVLALKALTAIADHTQSQVGGELRIEFAGEVIGQAALPSDPRGESAIEITGLGTRIEELADNRDVVEIELIGIGCQNLSYTVDVVSHVTTPDSDQACPLRLSTELSGQLAEDGSVGDGESLKVETELVNNSKQGLPMTVAIIGLPGGLEPRAAELDELQKTGAFDYYETRGREVIFYWRTMEPGAVKPVAFNVTATIPGKYTGPASRAYLYYTAEQKQWVEPLKVEVRK